MKSKFLHRVLTLCIAPLLLTTLSAVHARAAEVPELISARNTAIPPPAAILRGGTQPAMSSDGRFVAFQSESRQFVAGDTNRTIDIFVRDRATDQFERVSVSSQGREGDGASLSPAISGNGRFVAFVSSATNLVPNDTNGVPDVFVHDRQTGLTTRVSVDSNGHEFGGDKYSPTFSRDGRYIAFTLPGLLPGDPDPSTAASDLNTYIHDRFTGHLERIGFRPDPQLGRPASIEQARLNADGRFVVFMYSALQDEDDHVGRHFIFIQDRVTGETRRVDVAQDGTPADGLFSETPAISDDGRYVAFSSDASNLASGTRNGIDILLADRTTGIITRVSSPAPGATGVTDWSSSPSISGDGRFVAFSSLTSNLVPGDTNDAADVFVLDRQTGVMRRRSIASSGAQANDDSIAPVLGAHGGFVAFTSTASNLAKLDLARGLNEDVFVHDASSNTTTAATGVPNTNPSRTAASHSYPRGQTDISANGRYVVFQSEAPDLVPGDTNNAADTFVRDRQTGAFTRVSVTSSGQQSNGWSWGGSISGDGRYVVFSSLATNLDPGGVQGGAFLHDRTTHETRLISRTLAGAGATGEDPVISPDGRYIAYASTDPGIVPGDTNGAYDVFVYDRLTRLTKRISVDSFGNQGNNSSSQGSFSADGRYISFSSWSSNFFPGDINHETDVFLHDLTTGATTLLSTNVTGRHEFEESSYSGVVSADGRFVAFTSGSPHLVADDTNQTQDVFLHDRHTGKNQRISLSSTGKEANGPSYQPSISADGRYVAFASAASNLAAGDMNGAPDVFVHDTWTGSTVRVSRTSSGAEANGESFSPGITADGREIVFGSRATNLVRNDENEATDVFVQPRPTAVVIRVDAGGPGLTDSRGHRWSADFGFNTGSASRYLVPIAATTDDALYQTERWDAGTLPELRYRFPLRNGSYLVRLYFAENYQKTLGVARRVFDVELEGVRRLNDVDVFAAAGAHTALVRSVAVDVKDGQLDILFRHQTQNPIIDAIEVIEQ